MQKFNGGEKVNKVKGYKFPGKVVAVFKPSNGEWRYVVEMENYGLLHIFNGEQLEGELLEGGTVEKEDYVSCSNGCYHKSSYDCAHDCHNKKEEKSAVGDCIYGGFCIHHLCKDFNRETPKIEEIVLDGTNFNWYNLTLLAEKLNEVIHTLNERLQK